LDHHPVDFVYLAPHIPPMVAAAIPQQAVQD
jgi:hypothetical protein